ncbi:hypothetical protein CASFOL_004913 [Castilleja foliolosa]|uniref:Uncharacterized protein n=1 Tax=Castilleja foliolosa TaxID=1961234 RepID=A0ABD3EFF1_9LAMI
MFRNPRRRRAHGPSSFSPSGPIHMYGSPIGAIEDRSRADMEENYDVSGTEIVVDGPTRPRAL